MAFKLSLEDFSKAQAEAKKEGRQGSRKVALKAIGELVKLANGQPFILDPYNPDDKDGGQINGFLAEIRESFEDGLTKGLIKQAAVDFGLPIVLPAPVKVKVQTEDGEEKLVPRFLAAKFGTKKAVKK